MTGVRLPELNAVLLSGRLTADGEMFYTQSGMAKCSLRLAVNRRVKDAKTGEWKDNTLYLDVVAWKDLAERSKERAKKGAPVVVEGRLSGREYEDKSGQKRAVLEVVANRIQFLASSEGAASPRKSASAEAAPAAEADSLEEVPF